MKQFVPRFSTAVFIASVILLAAGCSDKSKDAALTSPTDTLKLFTGNQYAAIDQSPLDISYFPEDYPQNKISGTQAAEVPVARVIYSRPHKKGRVVFSNDAKSICPYGKPWRLGANEATEIDFFRPVVIDGKNIAAGRYVMYCIPFADKWIFALNSNLDSWGLQIDPSKDILRTEIPTQKQVPSIEDFTIVFQPATYGTDLLCLWDNVKILLPISFSK
jgi:hypothetical protein